MVLTTKGSISISSGELSYLIAIIGGRVLPGIEIDYSSLSTAELKVELADVQRKLEKKLLIQVNFDGTLEIASDIFEELSIIAFCSRVINQTVRINGVIKSYQYFFRESELVELTQDQTEAYSFKRIWALHDLQMMIVERNGLQAAYEFEFKQEKVDSVNNLTHYCTLNSFTILNDLIDDVRESSFIIADNKLLRVSFNMIPDNEPLIYSLVPIEFNMMMTQTTQFITGKE
ncbi:hypothetical protein EHS13_30100 [Paenibacillus psychroresistens]|uniref:Uncharacterized protein n=1 Tax=Paenibacillus psychroresistens TaxID=1778678 RepID=A0A6B8RR16_9BACL|nr:hypothetical protein [Paenibacillus psychroresistens]QGQ98830.1 hypothetical protein EHS13_30100 [Paenibacillus psychroresistens]